MCIRDRFWWQEGHTIHETAAEAEAETQQQLNCYADVCEQDLAIDVYKRQAGGRSHQKKKRFLSSGFVLYWSYPKHNEIGRAHV